MNEFQPLCQELLDLLLTWEPMLMSMSQDLIMEKRNGQDRNIRQIVGHMVDSASNNTHRMVHLQYRESPLRFPNYARHGNNDRWIISDISNCTLMKSPNWKIWMGKKV
jgi:hypothetical protein